MFKKIKQLRGIGGAIALVLVCSVSLPGYSSSPEPLVVVHGKPLKHLGTGLEEYLFFDIYELDAYTESGACALSDIVYTSEAKMLRLTMSRHIPVNHLKWQVKKNFERNLPKNGNDSLKKKVSTFLSYFKHDLPKGTAVDIAYVPGYGSTIKEDGRPLGPPIPGPDFPVLTWRTYFGGNTCCEQGRNMIIEQCRQGSR